MSTFTVSLKLEKANKIDYERFSQELDKKFVTASVLSGLKKSTLDNPSFIFKSEIKTTIVDLSAAISSAAHTTGKKYFFTIIKEKEITEYKTELRQLNASRVLSKKV